MRNLKKFLALVLAMMMVLSLMVTVNAASSTYSDADKISATYKTAVDVLTAVGVFQGDEGGFRPTDPIKRSEFAKVIYMINSGDTKAVSASLGLYADACDFRDIAGSGEEWAKSFIGYASTYGLVKGSGPKGDFYPKDYISVVDVLTILLRTLGYGQGSELEGKLYQVNALRLAEEAGLLTNIPDGITTKNAERQVVAQLIYNVIQAPTVTAYNTTTGKYTVGGTPLATSSLKMVKEKTEADEWGKPISGGWLYNGETISDSPAVFVKRAENYVSECDIWDVFELDGDIVAYYVDGIKQNITDDTKDDYNPVFSSGASVHTDVLQDHPTYYTGGPGVVTEAYLVDGGYWIIQYHVWLAQVTKVNPATTDENGHPTGITYDVNIFVAYDEDGDSADVRNVTLAARGCETEDDEVAFVKGDYVLVHVNLPVYDKDEVTLKATKSGGFVTVAGAAPVLDMGEIDEIYNSVITVNKTDYDESWNYFLNFENEIDEAVWTFFGDGMEEGNIIGQVQGASFYAVVEKIEWKHHTDKVGNGYALADIMLYDGTRKEGVRVPYVATATGSYTPTRNTGDDGTGAIGGLVSDDYTSNGAWYGHVFQYTEQDDGSFWLKHVGSPDANALILKGNARIRAQGGDYTADDDTIFFVRNTVTGYSYEVFVGIDELGYASLRNDTAICVVADETGYAKAVVAVKPSAPSTSPVYFIEEGTAVSKTGTNSNNEKYYAEMCLLGSTKVERVQVDKNLVDGSGTAKDPYVLKSGAGFVTATGLYMVTKNPNGVITAVKPITNGNFYGVEDGNNTTGKMTENGSVLVATNRHTGMFYIENKWNINSVQALSDEVGENPMYATTGGNEKIGINNGAAGMIVPNDSVRNGYTVDATKAAAGELYDYYDFRLTDATVIKVNLAAVGTALTGDYTLTPGTKDDITTGSLVLFVFDWTSSNREANVIYAYVYKVVQVEAPKSDKILSIYTDNIVGCELLDKEHEGKLALDSKGNGEFIVTAPTAQTSNGIRVIYNKDQFTKVEIFNLKDEAGVSTWRVKITGMKSNSNITVVANTITKDPADPKTSTAGSAPSDQHMVDLYTTLGIAVSKSATDGVITINITKANFNGGSEPDHKRLAEGQADQATPAAEKGDKGYVGVSFGAPTKVLKNFTVDGELKGDFDAGDYMYFAVATYDGTKMVLDAAPKTHTVTYEYLGQLYTFTVKVVYA